MTKKYSKRRNNKSKRKYIKKRVSYKSKRKYSKKRVSYKSNKRRYSKKKQKGGMDSDQVPSLKPAVFLNAHQTRLDDHQARINRNRNDIDQMKSAFGKFHPVMKSIRNEIMEIRQSQTKKP